VTECVKTLKVGLIIILVSLTRQKTRNRGGSSHGAKAGRDMRAPERARRF